MEIDAAVETIRKTVALRRNDRHWAPLTLPEVEALCVLLAEREHNVCPDCKNVFLQPFRCVTCGAQKLYDVTLANAQQRAEAVEAENTKLHKNIDLLLADLEAAEARLREFEQGQAEVKALREALAELLDHVEMQNCDVIGAVQSARAALAGGE
jgi:hypothetical protein